MLRSPSEIAQLIFEECNCAMQCQCDVLIASAAVHIALAQREALEAAEQECEERAAWRWWKENDDPYSVDMNSASHGAGVCASAIRKLLP